MWGYRTLSVVQTQCVRVRARSPAAFRSHRSASVSLPPSYRRLGKLQRAEKYTATSASASYSILSYFLVRGPQPELMSCVSISPLVSLDRDTDCGLLRTSASLALPFYSFMFM